MTDIQEKSSEPVQGTSRLCLRFAKTTAIITGILALAVVLAGPLSRLGILDYRTAITILMVGAFASLVTMVLALIALVCAYRTKVGQSFPLSGASLAVSLAIAATLWMMASAAREVPPIHDITTDMVDPPAFEAVVALRQPGENSTDYAGIDTVGSQQANAYPDLETLYVMEPREAVFDRALRTVRAMGWEIVTQDPERGRIEATATTAWFGFKDDVVIRIEDAPGGAVALDVRSASRVGVSDLGANAARIRVFLATFDDYS